MAVDISPTKDGGLLKEILREGTSEDCPYPGSKVAVHYVGTLLDGTKFDSSRDRNDAFRFDLGQGSVIKAWEIGIATMKKGELAVLTCAPEYAYGKNGMAPKIPPDSTLKFEVELLDWVGQDLSPGKDGSIEKVQIFPGKGNATAHEGGLIEIHLTGEYNGRVFEDRDISFILGEGEDHGVLPSIEVALESFKKGEKARVKLKSKYAYTDKGKPEFDIPPGADVDFIIEMKNFQNPADMWSMDAPQKMEQTKMFKDKGTNYFKEGKYNLAIKMYKKALEYIENEETFKKMYEHERISLLEAINSNLALCYLKTDANLEARDACNSALKSNPNNEKALFRRGQALLKLAAPDDALKDFEAVLKIEPNNSAAAKQIQVCNEIIKKELVREKKLYANMFDKFAKKDRENEEKELRKQPDVMHGVLGEWGQEERPGGRDATAFEKENPNILMLNANGSDEFKNM